MNSICSSNDAATHIEVAPTLPLTSSESSRESSTDHEDALEEENSTICFIVGNQFCGKSTFQKRIQMFANAYSLHYNDINLFKHLDNKDVSLFRLRMIATILYMLELIIKCYFPNTTAATVLPNTCKCQFFQRCDE